MVIKSEITFYYFALVVLAIVIYLIYRWQRSRFGRAVAALRENENLARSIGIAPLKLYSLAFAFACALGGISGLLNAFLFVVYVSDGF